MKAAQHHQKAQQLIYSEDYKDALKEIRKAVALEPKNADFISEYGVILFHLKRKLEAIEQLNKALELEPKNPYRYSSRAYVKDSIGDTQGAIDDYLKCIELDPEDAVAYNNLGLLEEKLGRKQQAKKRFEKADELASILEENNITLESKSVEETVAPRNIQKEIQEERKEAEEKGRLGIMIDVLRDKKTRQEFVKFIKGGFKNSDDDIS